MKILWLAPNFNHYKARFLNHLAKDEDINLTILSGAGRNNMGDQELVEDWDFIHIKVDVLKKDFGKSKEVKQQLKSIFGNFDWVLIPAEKKNIPLLLFAGKLRKQYPNVRLFSYNHAQFKSKKTVLSVLDSALTRFFYKKLDKVIFYTENAREKAINQRLISLHKAFWANNTIDNTEIEKYYSYQLPSQTPTIVFIGRLIASKRVKDLIAYYKAIKLELPNLELEIIGDGPEQIHIKNTVEADKDIKWHGTLVDEAKIAPIMKRASIVFVPGLSGLSINHAFAYGRSYVTLVADKHGPEISYLNHNENGYLLNGNFEENTKAIASLLKNRDKLEQFCNNAMQKGHQLSVSRWVQQIKLSLVNG
ncbi:glycosyltransferase family 4 protein [Winogradskyella sp.]|uniref:glycosyltransferase family 4 protein n=1 Tax=Winogradskyella sp. TaxID=1883156 RepID=UPI001B205987|nr:glycosyltransferase family 4 protein [Winogradskyella sp.]MBO6881099.1 glycosyltransferase family 4 protein [Winogradskyella sp.]